MTLQLKTNRELREQLLASLVIIRKQSEMLRVAKEALSDMVTPNLPIIGDKFPLNRKIDQCKKALATIEQMEKL